MLNLHGYVDFILSNSALKGLSLIVLSIVSAKFVDMIFTFIFKYFKTLLQILACFLNIVYIV